MVKYQPGFELGAAQGSQRQGNSARNSTRSSALGQAKQGMLYRQEMLMARTTPKAMEQCFIFMLEKLWSASYWCRKGFDLAVPGIPYPAFTHDEGEKGDERKQQAAKAIAPFLTPSLMQEKARKRRI